MPSRSCRSQPRWSWTETGSERPAWPSEGVAHKPWRDLAAEAALRGQPTTEATFAQAADLVLRDAKGFEHFKIDLARRAIIRALTQAAAGTPQSQSDKKIR